MNKVNLKNYICSVPFNSLEVHNNVFFTCCPSWLPNKIEQREYPVSEVWKSAPMEEIRESILDGSFRYCDKEMCPYLSKLINYGITSGPIGPKSDYPFLKTEAPKNIVMNFDRSCNYKCPSCRNELIIESIDGIKRVEKTISEIDEHYSKSLKTIYITGTGDPFVSVGFRNYLRNFNPSKYPSLEKIHLHTNASMWDKKMWDTMPNIHKYVRTCEISIDAGTKETYETKTRLGGNWEKLIDNLNFISTIPTLKNIKTSFVVQDSNYKEMGLFYDQMYKIFGKKVSVYYGKITNWGTFSDYEFNKKMIWDKTHPDHQDFINEFEKVWRSPKVFHNLYEFIDKDESKKTLI